MEIQVVIEKIAKCQILIEYYEEQLEREENKRFERNLDLINRKMRELLDEFRFQLLIGNFQFNIIILGYLIKLKVNNKDDITLINIYDYLVRLVWENINDLILQITYDEFDEMLTYVDHLIDQTKIEEMKKEFEKVYIAISNSLKNDPTSPRF